LFPRRLSELERLLRQQLSATDVLRELLHAQRPTYYRSCHVLAEPQRLPPSFPNLLWPSCDPHGQARRPPTERELEYRIEACGSLAHLQASTASLPYLCGMQQAFRAADRAQPWWTDAAAGIESRDGVRELNNTLQSLVDNYCEEN